MMALFCQAFLVLARIPATLHHGAVGWYAVCGHGISWSYLLLNEFFLGQEYEISRTKIIPE